MLYIAYGSNLNKDQMSYRCPKARFVGSGLIKDYKLKFKVHLTIEPSEGDWVPVGLWEINLLDEWRRLDRYEGLPTYYRKEKLKVIMGNKEVEGIVYLMNPVYKYLHVPTDSYYQICADGYRDCGLSLSYLESALKDAQIYGGKYE